jgi:hypothetical protein
LAIISCGYRVEVSKNGSGSTETGIAMSKTSQQPQKRTSSRSTTVQREEQESALRKAQTPAIDAQHITPEQVPYLQRVMGNRAVVQLLRDQRSGQIQRNFAHGATSVAPVANDERMKKIEELQRAPLNSIQRMGEEDEEEGEG